MLPRQSKSLISRGLSATLAFFALPAHSEPLAGVDRQHFVELVQAGAALDKSKDRDKARAKFTEALDLATKCGDDAKAVAVSLRIGATYRDQNNLPAAEEYFRKTLVLADALQPQIETHTSNCLYQLAETLIRQKKDAEAKPIFARCLEVSASVFSANNPVLAVRKAEYASILSRLGEKEEAAKLNRESAAVVDAFMTDMSKKIKSAWHQPPEKFSYRIAVSYEVLNHGKVRDIEVTKSSGSEIADRAAIDAVKNGAPFLDIDSKDPLEKFGMAFTFDFNYHERRPSSAAGADIRSQSAEYKSAPSRQVKAETEAKLKAEKEKSEELKEKIENALQAKPEEAAALASLADLYAQYAESLAVQGHYEAGVAKLNEALSKDCFKKSGDPSRVSLMISLAHIHLYADDAARAEPILKDATAQAGFEHVPAKLRQSAYEDYGNCLTKEKRFAEAQDYFNRARDIKE